MAEIQGDIALSTNVAIRKEWTFDDRGYVTSYAKLLSSFTAADKLPNGFPVAVWDTDPKKRGIYQLIDKANLTLAASWERIGSEYEPETPAAPAGAKWNNPPKVSVSKQSDTTIRLVSTSGNAYWNGVLVEYDPVPGIDDDLVLPTGEDLYLVYVYGTSGGTLELHIGPTSTTPQAPPVPSTGLYLTYYLITATGPEVSLESLENEVSALKVNKAENRIPANLWAWIGLASSSATITVKGWLDFLSNRVKLAEEAIATKLNASVVKTVVNNTDAEVTTSKGLIAFVEAAVSEGTYGTSSLIQPGKYLTPLYLTQWGSFFSQVHSTNLGMVALFYPVDKPIKTNGIQVHVNTADAANTTVFGLYRCGLNGRPADLLANIGTATWDTTGVINIAFPEITVNPPGFFIGHQSNAANASLRAVAGSNGISLLGVTGIHTNQVSVIGFIYANTYPNQPLDLSNVTESGTVSGTTVTMGIAVKKSA